MNEHSGREFDTVGWQASIESDSVGSAGPPELCRVRYQIQHNNLHGLQEAFVTS